jgi:NAD(P)-dependent dehydrogenase (short-subunit alcohol dehydrogenase family)|tara:strand:- start:1664 stop:2416 length:753 start_codon:yes stop_codon:yes gene_type:complete
MKLNFKGKTAVVTGGSGGVGLSTVEKLIKEKIHVLALDIKEPPNKILKNKFFDYQKIDLTDFSETEKIINSFYKKFKSIDYLVNATGVLWFDKDKSAEEMDLDIWDKVFEINLKTMAYLIKIIVPKMKKNKFGSMVHISSIDALSGDDKPQDAYGASKAAMIRFSKSLAIQYGSFNIRSNTILPGAIETPMQDRWKKNPKAKKKMKDFMPIKKIIQPDGVASGVMFLLSDESAYTTGTELIIDGGITARP